MFQGARRVVIEGGSFSVNADTAKKIDISRLLNMVAPNAILNAGGRGDEVRCFPGTREEVIGMVEKWMERVKDGSCINRVMWLSGPAGAGKSAICQTVAERCPTRRQQAANFFFFRGDQTRNSARPLVATLVYQIRDLYPMVDELISNCLEAHPLIFKASIENQFSRLLSSPMQTLKQSSGGDSTMVIIVDGLDDCDDIRTQCQILMALHALAGADHSPFLVLVASRTEPHLVMSFNRLGGSVESIFLNDEYRPQRDIHRFVTAKFSEIKQHHHLRELLSKDWPKKSDIQAITDKSPGQFIYAATVMRFIEHSPESPDLSLAIIIEMQPSTTASHNPLAQLDAVYSYIFSKVHNIRAVKQVFCAYFIAEQERHDNVLGPKCRDLLQLAGVSLVEVKSLFANLGAIIKVSSEPLDLLFYHASLHDYLKAKSRSQDFHVDIGEIAAQLSAICLRNFNNQTSSNFTARCLSYVQRQTAELSESLLDASTRPQHRSWESEEVK